MVTISRKQPEWMRTPCPMWLPNSSTAFVPTETSSPSMLSSRIETHCPVCKRAPMTLPA